MTLDACAGIVARGDPDRFLATMSVPAAARLRLWPLYAFNVEVARAPWLTTEPMIAEMRLQWWRDALDEIDAGKPARAHEVAGPLAALMTEARLSGAVLDQMVLARRWDIAKAAFEDDAAFAAHIDQTAGNLMWMAFCALGAPAGLEATARDIGWASGVANWLVAVPAYEASGRLPLVDGRPAAVRALAQEARARLRAARRGWPRAMAPALRAAWQAEAILAQAASQPERVAAGALGTSEFRRKTGLMLKAAIGSW